MPPMMREGGRCGCPPPRWQAPGTEDSHLHVPRGSWLADPASGLHVNHGHENGWREAGAPQGTLHSHHDHVKDPMGATPESAGEGH